jgi:hypothetical protein
MAWSVEVLISIIKEEAVLALIPTLLALRLAQAESDLCPDRVTRYGPEPQQVASGLFQLSQEYEWALEDPLDPRQNARCGLTHLRGLYERSGGNWVEALASYTCGEDYVADLHAKHGVEWFLYLPDSVKGYISAILFQRGREFQPGY